MKRRLVTLFAAAMSLSGCVAGVRQVASPPRAAQANPPAASLTAYATPDAVYPTIGGNVLAGTSPEVQAAARAAAIRPPPTGDAP